MVGNVNKVGVREVTHFGEGCVMTTTAVVFKDQAFHRFRVATWPTNAPVKDTTHDDVQNNELLLEILASIQKVA